MEQIKNQDTGEVVAVFCSYHKRWEVVSSNFAIVPHLHGEEGCVLTLKEGARARLAKELVKAKADILDLFIEDRITLSGVTDKLLEYTNGVKDGLVITHFTKLSDLMSFLIFHGLYPLSGIRGFKFDHRSQLWAVISD